MTKIEKENNVEQSIVFLTIRCGTGAAKVIKTIIPKPQCFKGLGCSIKSHINKIKR